MSATRSGGSRGDERNLTRAVQDGCSAQAARGPSEKLASSERTHPWKTLTKTITAAAIVGALALPATGALAASKTEKAVVGALIGGLLGAAVSNGDSTATIAGVAAGAAIGASTGSNNRYDSRYDRRYDSRGRYVQPTRYNSYDNRYGARYDNRSGYGYDQRVYDQRGYDPRYSYGYR